MKIIKIIGLEVVVLVFIILVAYSVQDVFITEHEEAHLQIFDYYDINSSIEYGVSYGFRVSGRTIPNEEYTLPEDRYYDMMFLHSLNEVFGYHLMALGHAWVAGIGLLCMVLTLLCLLSER